MPSELRDGLPATESPEIPDLEAAIVRTRGQQIRHISVPADNVHVLLVRLEAEHRPVLLAEVPDGYGLVGGAGRENLRHKAGNTNHCLQQQQPTTTTKTAGATAKHKHIANRNSRPRHTH